MFSDFFLTAGAKGFPDAARAEAAPAAQKAPADPCRKIAGQGGTASVASLEKATEHEDPWTAREAAWALARVPHPSASEALHRVLKTDKRAEVRQIAALALGRRCENNSRQVLREVARTDPDGEVRAEAVAAVGMVGTLEDVALLAEVAATDADPIVQSRAVAAAGALLGITFHYDTKASEAERRKMLETIRSIAPTMAQRLREAMAQEGTP
ncbi:MAG: HEAT repeat domain-containing protein [Phycisphaerae bacterium]